MSNQKKHGLHNSRFVPIQSVDVIGLQCPQTATCDWKRLESMKLKTVHQFTAQVHKEGNPYFCLRKQERDRKGWGWRELGVGGGWGA